ncbi:hypothetical protein PI124_g9863 [Phytophthora idaei]|nr:hypothetical protein PI125_g9161 [Phytophthora idaei]KAG3161962.1 hypothetical protein PI126_g6190 [Phytophthora idaei]KAG3245401.1 hypothetical protein PI124_g9863 [Phytophthora idaei]
MRISFALMAATASTLLASSNTLPTDLSTTSLSTALQPDLVQLIHAPNADEAKRFLRIREMDSIGHEESEERTMAGDKAKMLTDKAYRKSIFKQWLEDNHSSMSVYEFFDVDNFKQYPRLYNKCAALHKESGQYP